MTADPPSPRSITARVVELQGRGASPAPEAAVRAHDLLKQPRLSAEWLVTRAQGIENYLGEMDEIRRQAVAWAECGWLPEMERINSALEARPSAYGALEWHESPAVWAALLDVELGPSKETLGSLYLEARRNSGDEAFLLWAVEHLVRARLSLYLHSGFEADRVLLSAILAPGVDASTAIRCELATTFRGRPGQVWLTRLLPPPHPLHPDHVVVEAPHVIEEPCAAGWRRAAERGLLESASEPARQAVFAHMVTHGQTRKSSGGTGRRLRGPVDFTGAIPLHGADFWKIDMAEFEISASGATA